MFLQRTTEYRGGMPKPRLNRVLEYINANLSEDIRLSELARTAGMSAHYFSELFKQTTGVSPAPHQYVLRQKIERASKEHLRRSVRERYRGRQRDDRVCRSELLSLKYSIESSVSRRPIFAIASSRRSRQETVRTEQRFFNRTGDLWHTKRYLPQVRIG